MKRSGAEKVPAGLLTTHFDLIADAEFLLTEGGGIRQRDGEALVSRLSGGKGAVLDRAQGNGTGRTWSEPGA